MSLPSENQSRVILDGMQSATWRRVYGLQRHPEQRVQFGYVQVDYGYVPVWRPYDPDDDRWDAPWADGLWRNVYRLHMPRDQGDPKRPTYGLVPFEDQVRGGSAVLPRVAPVMNRHLREHLDSLQVSSDGRQAAGA